ncbi:MAG: branched-chain amino acid aminotransferase [Hyphomicrobiales bacterium]|nr:branched-chain amino acid aminotransferase [Hyphomicrobiales bacterium]
MPLVPSQQNYSRTWTYFDGNWHEGNVAIMGPRTHAAWLGSMVFDGGRVFEGVWPDLDLHLARVNRSARAMLLKPLMSEAEWMALAQEGMKKFDGKTALYVRPMYWAEVGSVGGGVKFDPETTRFCLCLYEAAMPEPKGFSVTLSPFRKPTPETAPTDAKAGCLYPNNARALHEAASRGFDNALVCDMLGHVAELANSNVFMVKDGVVMTPAANGTFLSGITRARVASLLRAAGREVRETTLSPQDFFEADEIFATGNFSKVVPVTRIGERALQPGPTMQQARKLYWDYAHGRIGGG